MAKKPNFFDWIAFILVIVGALNWGFVGLFSFNLVEYLFSCCSVVTTIIYVLVALAGIWEIFFIARMSK